MNLRCHFKSGGQVLAALITYAYVFVPYFDIWELGLRNIRPRWVKNIDNHLPPLQKAVDNKFSSVQRYWGVVRLVMGHISIQLTKTHPTYHVNSQHCRISQWLKAQHILIRFKCTHHSALAFTMELEIVSSGSGYVVYDGGVAKTEEMRVDSNGRGQ